MDELATNMDTKMKGTADEMKKHVKEAISPLEAQMAEIQTHMKQQRTILTGITEAFMKNKKTS